MSIKQNAVKLTKFVSVFMVVMIMSITTLLAQSKVTGKVTDNSGEPLAGVSVLVKNSKTTTFTDNNGLYSISCAPNAILQFSIIGFKDVEVEVNNRSIVNVVMQEDAEMLEERVVVGFGTQKKINLTGAVAPVDVDKVFNSKPISDVSKGLQGVVPGLTITFNTNDLGASPTMKIRGTGSVNGSNPLILLDGVEIPDLSFVNPDNIKDISVLKDAASSSIYGSRAAWGVVLITTKDGSGAKDKVAITYSNNLSWSTPIGLPKYITDKEGIIAQLNEGILAQKNTDGTDIEAFSMYYKDLIDPISYWFDNYKKEVKGEVWKYGRDYTYTPAGVFQSYRVSDPNKEMFKTSFNHNHNINIAGNSGNTRYNIGVGYNKQDSNMRAAKDTYVQRVTANLSLNSQLNKWLNVGTKILYTEKINSYPRGYEASSGAMGLLYYTMRFPTFFPFGISDGAKLDDDTYLNDNTASGEGLYFRHGNGLLVGEPINTAKDEYLTIGANTKINILPNLVFNADYTRGRYNYVNKGLFQPVYVANWWSAWSPKQAYTTNNYTTRSFVQTITNTANAWFDYTYELQKHNFAAKLGLNQEDYWYNYHSLRSNGVQDPNRPTLNITDGKNEGLLDEIMTHRGTYGFFGRINYDYESKYLLELNGRYDGSSRFRKGKKWAFFSSASAGWRISSENFWEPIKPYVNTLKLRASYGSIGNQALDNFYPYIATISTATSSWIGPDGLFKSTTTPPGNVNQDMTWEKIKTLNIGLDASFLDGDLNATFDWYSRRNIGMLVTGNQVVRYTGIASAPLENGGNLKTNGWELQLDYRHAFSNELSMYATFTLADSKSKITKWNNTNGILTDYYEGKQIGEIWGFVTDRYWNLNDDPAHIYDFQGKYLQKGNFVYGPGDIKYTDLDGDGTITTGKGTIDDHGDLKRIGNQLPRYEYALRVGAAWKGFDMEVLFQGVGKRDMWTISTLFLPHSAGAQMNIFSNQLDYWTENNQNAKFPRPYIGHTGSTVNGLVNYGNNNYYPQTKYLANLAYLRLKNLTIGYTLPGKLTSKAGIQKVRVYVSGYNLLTWDHIDGVMDPELTGGWSSSTSNGIDMNYAGRAIPFNRQWSFGVQVTF